MKLCKDCRHFVDDRGWLARILRERSAIWSHCQHPSADASDDRDWQRVDGRHEPKWMDCSFMRRDGGICVPEGKHFEPKKNPVVEAIKKDFMDGRITNFRFQELPVPMGYLKPKRKPRKKR
jgi:hypothetical protein